MNLAMHQRSTVVFLDLTLAEVITLIERVTRCSVSCTSPSSQFGRSLAAFAEATVASIATATRKDLNIVVAPLHVLVISPVCSTLQTAGCPAVSAFSPPA